MADTLTTITDLINSPPGQLVAGGVLAGIVWKFFERVEAVLNEDTKLEIAVWLFGVKTEHTVQHWPQTFLVLFDAVFGSVHPSWKGLRRAFLATVLSYLILILIAVNHIPEIAASLQLQIPPDVNWKLLAFGMTFAVIAESAIMTVPDYVSLMFTRRIIIRFHQSRAMILKVLGILFLTFSATYLILGSGLDSLEVL